MQAPKYSGTTHVAPWARLRSCARYDSPQVRQHGRELRPLVM